MPPRKKTAPPPKKKKAAPTKSLVRAQPHRKYDWEKARENFVEGWPSDPTDPDSDRDWPNLRELSDRLGIPYARVREKAGQERWTDRRQAHQTTVARERQKNRVQYLGKQSIAFDNRSLDVAKAGMRLVLVRLAEIAAGVQAKEPVRKEALEAMQRGEPIDWKRLSSFIKDSELQSLARAAADFQHIGMKAMGTDVDRAVLQVEGEVSVAHTIDITTELKRDDPERLAAFLAAADRAGIFEQLELGEDDDLQDEEEGGDEDEEVVEAELVEDEDE